MNIYYVYAYLRSKDSVNAKAGTPYYIGKGKDKRAFLQHKTPNNSGVPTPVVSCIVFLETNLSEIGSLALERRYIEWYGRLDKNTGILHNRTDGGDGTSGRIQSEEAKIKIGAASANRIRKPVSEETRKRQSVGGKGLKRSDETRTKISAAFKGKAKSEEACKNMSIARKGSPGTFTGRTHSQESKEKMRISALNRKRVKQCYNKEKML